MITNEQWLRYLEKYENLLWAISRKISGDIAISNHIDNYSDLCVAALKSIEGYGKKTGKSFDEMIEEKLFDQYTKTVLWNHKNKKGLGITKKLPLTNKILSMHEMHNDDMDQAFDIEDTSTSSSESYNSMLEMLSFINDDMKKVIESISSDPSVLNYDGKLNLTSLSRATGLSIHFTRKAVQEIEEILKVRYLSE